MEWEDNKENGPNRRGHGPLCRTIGSAALVALGCYAGAASADIKTDLGVDYRATGFYVHSDSFGRGTTTANPGETTNHDDGFAQYLRLKANFKDTDTGVEVHTRVEIAGDRWSGDARGYRTTARRAFNTANNGDNVRMDLAFVQLPLGATLLRVGRQEANWNNCFLVCDDRRDRVIALHKFFGANAFIGYDRRADTQAFLDEDNGNMGFTGAVIPLGKTDWTLGLLYVHWFNNFIGDAVGGAVAQDSSNIVTTPAGNGVVLPYVLANTDLFSPYIQGKLGPINVAAGFDYLIDGNVQNSGTPAKGDFFTGNAWSEYARLGIDVGILELKAQYVGAQDGGLISSGFDTYSSLINSNPESTANPTSVYTMGGYLGRKGYNQNLYIGNVVANITPKFALSGSVGALNIQIPGATGGSDTSMVYDLQASYQINSALRTWATAGWLGDNDVGALSGNTLLGSIPNGGSFASNGVFAGSINLGVAF